MLHSPAAITWQRGGWRRGGPAKQCLFDSVFLVFPWHSASESMSCMLLFLSCLSPSRILSIPLLFVIWSFLAWLWWWVGDWISIVLIRLIPWHSPFFLGLWVVTFSVPLPLPYSSSGFKPAPPQEQGLKIYILFLLFPTTTPQSPSFSCNECLPTRQDQQTMILFYNGDWGENPYGVYGPCSPVAAVFISVSSPQGLLLGLFLIFSWAFGRDSRGRTCKITGLPEFLQPQGFTLGFHQPCSYSSWTPLTSCVLLCLCEVTKYLHLFSLPALCILNIGPVGSTASAFL